MNKLVWREQGWIMADRGSVAPQRDRGFSLLELMIVLAIVMIVLAFAVPLWMTGTRTAKIRGAESDFASLLQMARMRAANISRWRRRCSTRWGAR